MNETYDLIQQTAKAICSHLATSTAPGCEADKEWVLGQLSGLVMAAKALSKTKPIEPTEVTDVGQ